jgi:adenylylsulfate kinase (EC 2.7.1.25)
MLSLKESEKAEENFIVPYNGHITKKHRQKLNGHKSFVLWFTGLPSSGKSTIAHKVELELYKRGIKTYVFDGDNIRTGLNKDLGFTEKERDENIRRIGEVIKLFTDAGLVVLTAFVSPLRKHREYVKSLLEDGEYIEIYVKCPPEKCAERDPKGHYEKAKLGIIKNFTGVDAPYEEPQSPDLVIETDKLSIDESVMAVLSFLKNNSLIP